MKRLTLLLAVLFVPIIAFSSPMSMIGQQTFVTDSVHEQIIEARPGLDGRITVLYEGMSGDPLSVTEYGLQMISQTGALQWTWAVDADVIGYTPTTALPFTDPEMGEGAIVLGETPGNGDEGFYLLEIFDGETYAEHLILTPADPSGIQAQLTPAGDAIILTYNLTGMMRVNLGDTPSIAWTLSTGLDSDLRDNFAWYSDQHFVVSGVVSQQGVVKAYNVNGSHVTTFALVMNVDEALGITVMPNGWFAPIYGDMNSDNMRLWVIDRTGTTRRTVTFGNVGNFKRMLPRDNQSFFAVGTTEANPLFTDMPALYVIGLSGAKFNVYEADLGLEAPADFPSASNEIQLYDAWMRNNGRIIMVGTRSIQCNDAGNPTICKDVFLSLQSDDANVPLVIQANTPRRHYNAPLGASGQISVAVWNNFDQPRSVDVWYECYYWQETDPDPSVPPVLANIQSTPVARYLEPGQTSTLNNFVVSLPTVADLAVDDMAIRFRVGTYPNAEEMSSDYITVTILPDGMLMSGDDVFTIAPEQPVQYGLTAVYPNPFNPTTTVSVSLSDVSDLSVLVYNMMGQQVAELANGQYNGGMHSFVLNGSRLASGVYFVRAHVPGEFSDVRRITLMK